MGWHVIAQQNSIHNLQEVTNLTFNGVDINRNRHSESPQRKTKIQCLRDRLIKCASRHMVHITMKRSIEIFQLRVCFILIDGLIYLFQLAL